jgi:hypothetical protein
MALYQLDDKCRCGANAWRLNNVDRDETAYVSSFSCFHCGRVREVVQERPYRG